MGDSDGYEPPLDPRGRCPWPPGTDGKVAAMELRLASGWALWHPDDAKHEDMHVVEGATQLFIDQSVTRIIPMRQADFTVFLPRHYASGKVRSERD
jgi:hypothetical protein